MKPILSPIAILTTARSRARPSTRSLQGKIAPAAAIAVKRRATADSACLCDASRSQMSFAWRASHAAVHRAPPLVLRPRPDIGPYLIDLLIGDHPGPCRHLALAVPHDSVEARPLVGTEQLEVRRRSGRHQPFAMTLRAMLDIDLPAGVRRRLRAR